MTRLGPAWEGFGSQKGDHIHFSIALRRNWVTGKVDLIIRTLWARAQQNFPADICASHRPRVSLGDQKSLPGHWSQTRPVQWGFNVGEYPKQLLCGWSSYPHLGKPQTGRKSGGGRVWDSTVALSQGRAGQKSSPGSRQGEPGQDSLLEHGVGKW